MRGGTVEVEVVFLYILAVVAFAVRQAEQAFFQDRVSTVPQSNRETELLFVVRDPCDAILSPTVSARAALVMTEVVPRIPILAVVFTHCAPLPLTEVRTPLLPLDAA